MLKRSLPLMAVSQFRSRSFASGSGLAVCPAMSPMPKSRSKVEWRARRDSNP